jgi:hypothetical protein
MTVTIKQTFGSQRWDWDGQTLKETFGSQRWDWDGHTLKESFGSQRWEADGAVPIPVLAKAAGII